MEPTEILIIKSASQSSQVKRSPVRWLPFPDMLEAVEEQLLLSSFEGTEKDLVKTMCLIVAEIRCMPAEKMVSIGGDDMPAEMVQTIYFRLQREHVVYVLANFERVAYQINHKKTYLRTALYNSVFEVEAGVNNDYNRFNPPDNPFGKRGQPT